MENDNDIRKKEKKLDSNHWMCKIQKYVLGIDAQNYYMGYCPFFWMTVLCIFLFPIILVWRLLITILSTIGGVIDSLLTKSIGNKITARKEYRTSELRKIPLIPADDIIVAMFNNFERYNKEGYSLETMVSYSDFTGRARWTDCIRMGLWFTDNPNWKEEAYPCAKLRIDERRKAYKLEQEKEREREQRWEATKRKLISKGAFCGKLIFKVAMVAVLAGIAFLIYAGIYKLVTTVSPTVFLQAAYIVCFILASIMVANIVIREIVHFVDSTESSCLLYKDSKQTEVRLIFKPFVIIFKIIAWVFVTAKKVICFIIEAIGMMYKEECPLIIWGDETGPIEKRNKEKES